MNDARTTIQELRDMVAKVTTDREWNQFHDPKNISMAIAAEAAELMEKFLWCTNQAAFQECEKDRQEVENELADIIWMAFCFANATGIDISKAIRHKHDLNVQKYPVEKAKGRYTKYNKL
jgi:dCTP diphosphatase